MDEDVEVDLIRDFEYDIEELAIVVKALEEILKGLRHTKYFKDLSERYNNIKQQLGTIKTKKIDCVIAGTPGSGKTEAINNIIAPEEFLQANGYDHSKVGRVPCTMSGYGHKTKVAMRFEYSNSPLFRAVATFSDETQFKLKQAKSIDYARIWPEERGFGEPKELYKCNTFYSLCKKMVEPLQKYLKSDYNYDELFALEYITIYGRWGMPETFVFIDTPGFSLSLAHDVVNANIFSTANTTLLVGARGPGITDLETLFKHGGLSGSSQPLLSALYRAESTVYNDIQTEMKTAVEELRGTIMSCVSSGIKLPIGTGLLERHTFCHNLARRACVFPFELLGNTQSRNKLFKDLRGSVMADMAENLTLSTAAWLMLCNKASGLPNMVHDSGKWNENCKKLRKELKEQVGEVSAEIVEEVSQCLPSILYNYEQDGLSAVGALVAADLHDRLYNVVAPLFLKTFNGLTSMHLDNDSNSMESSSDEESKSIVLSTIMSRAWKKNCMKEKTRICQEIAKDTGIAKAYQEYMQQVDKESEDSVDLNSNPESGKTERTFREKLSSILTELVEKLNQSFFKTLNYAWKEGRTVLTSKEEDYVHNVKDKIKTRINEMNEIVTHWYRKNADKWHKGSILPPLKTSVPLPTPADLRVEQDLFIDKNQRKSERKAKLSNLISKTIVDTRDVPQDHAAQNFKSIVPIIETDVKQVGKEVHITFHIGEQLKKVIGKLVKRSERAVFPTFIVSHVETSDELHELNLNLRFEKENETPDSLSFTKFVVVNREQAEMYKRVGLTSRYCYNNLIRQRN